MKQRLLKLGEALKQSFTNPRTRIPSFLAVFILLGLLTMLLIHAAQPNANVQPESNTNTVELPASRCAGSVLNTSGGCVQFGSGSSPAGTPNATVLTVVATDYADNTPASAITSNAVCIDNYATMSSSKMTACIQINPSDSTKGRAGTYDIVQKKFVPAGNWTSLPTVDSSHLDAGSRVASRSCSNGHTFYALGPLGTNYYGEEVINGTIKFGSMDTNNLCTTSGGGPIVSTPGWATPAIYCSNPASAISVTSVASAVASGSQNQEICVKPGTYNLPSTASPVQPKPGMKIIGASPIQRPIFDSSLIPTTTHHTGSFIAGGANITIANVVVQGAQQIYNGVYGTTGFDGQCKECGNGIDSGQNIHLYNDKLTHNGETGFHTVQPNYLLENSELSYNGNDSHDKTWSAGGMKTTNAGTIKNNVVTNNTGGGLWCDGNNTTPSKCWGGTWNITDNYVAGNYSNGIHFEIVFKNTTPTPWADIERNVVDCNNMRGNHTTAGIDIFAAEVWVKNNVFDNRNGPDIPQPNRCIEPTHKPVRVYNDGRATVGFYTIDVKVQNNQFEHSTAPDCDAQGTVAPHDPGHTVICSLNTTF